MVGCCARNGGPVVSARKVELAFRLAGISMPAVKAAIQESLREMGAVLGTMTTRQIASVIGALHREYHKGRASCDASVEHLDDVLWVGAGINKLICLDTIRALPAD